MPGIFELFPLLVNCGFRIRNVHGTESWYRLVHKIAVRQRIEPLICNKILMLSGFDFAHVCSRRFVGFNDTSVS